MWGAGEFSITQSIIIWFIIRPLYNKLLELYLIGHSSCTVPGTATTRLATVRCARVLVEERKKREKVKCKRERTKKNEKATTTIYDAS